MNELSCRWDHLIMSIALEVAGTHGPAVQYGA